MNEIDRKFFSLVDFLSRLSEEELKGYILYKFRASPLWYQQNMQAYFERFDYWGRINLECDNYEYFELKARDILAGLDAIVWFYKRLSDYTSKSLLYAILNNWVNCDTDTLKRTVDTRFRHYFDLDLIPGAKGAVLADLGAYVGDTALDFIATYGVNYKKIYCYEITEPIFYKLESNLSPYPRIDCRLKAVGDATGFVQINQNVTDISSNRTISNVDSGVERVTLDEDILEPLNIIKMDIEGDEYVALKGARRHIETDQPILLISVYHRNEHLWELPKLIESFNPDYRYYLRNYVGCVYPTEIVLIGIPKRKNRKK